MHIEEIILDGFKSYPSKTVIGPFHPQFNAITGLNGSGKSNVLDAICFVMGINNLNLIRVNRLDELIYKNGQAGITKGSVTIKFNNERKPSPLPEPYKDMNQITITRQIVVGGRNRYLMNSHNAKPKDIADFFQSLKLNINNPHFLIMQGKITKVINMSPKEILGLIEESSGTKLYEVKRTNALKLMAKKETKLEEIRKLLSTKIEPAVTKLKKEREEYNKYVNNSETIENFEKIKIAYQYYMAKNLMSESGEIIEEKKKEQTHLENENKEWEKALLEKIKHKEKLMEDSSGVNEPLKVLLKEKDQLKKRHLEVKTEMKRKEKECEKENARKMGILKEIEKIEKSLADVDKTNGMSETDKQFYEEIKKKKKDIMDELNDKQLILESLASEGNAGVQKGGDATEDHVGSIRDQLRVYKSDLTKVETEINNVLYTNKQLEKEILELSKEKEKNDTDSVDLIREKETEEKQIKLCEEELRKLNEKYNNFEDFTEKQKRQNQLIAEVDQLRKDLSVLNNMMNSVKIEYQLPNSMKPNDVLGQIYELIKIKKDYSITTLAVHLILGGKLTYLLVNNKENSKKLFEFNNFSKGSKKVTLLPLEDCVIGRDVSRKQIEDCRNMLGINKKDKTTIFHYMDIIDYEEKLEKLVRYLFNGTCICANVELCKKITYHNDKSMSFPTISLDGDKFDTSGSMSGGSTKNMNFLLECYENHVTKTKELKEKEAELIKAKEDVGAMLKADDYKKKITKDLHFYENNLKIINERFELSKYGKSYHIIEKHKEDIEKGRQKLAQMYEEQKVLTTKINKIEKDISEFENNKEKKERELKKQVEKLKKQIKDLEEEEHKKKEQLDRIQMQSQNLEKQLESERNELQEIEKTLEELKLVIMNMEEELKKNEERKTVIEKEIAELQETFSMFEQELNSVLKFISEMEKNIEDNSVKIKKLDNELQEVQARSKNATETYKYLRKSHIWIETYEDSFNKDDSIFDFKNIQFENMQKQIEELQIEQHKLSKSINRKALQMFEHVQAEYNDLVTKKEIVESDKKKIQEVIADLDVRKNESLLNMYGQINEYFQAIFSSLLHNAQAKLCMVDGDLKNGVEMKIGFHGQWKQSLTELSGGQRSLLALSLILAFLKVRTVPMYILDEVDAALDLNHTENIGDMIRTQFPFSQFIIVSLKEGMFTHADVLFKMRFIDGVSTVDRHALDEREIPSKKKEMKGNMIEHSKELKKRRISENDRKEKKRNDSKNHDENTNE